MKKNLISTVTLFIITAFAVFAQNEVKLYKSYNDYLEKKPDIIYNELVGIHPDVVNEKVHKSICSPKIYVLDENKKKATISIVDYWGFEYKGILFRNSDKKLQRLKEKYPEKRYYALIDTIDNGLYYWENALLVLKRYMDVKGVNSAYSFVDYGSYTRFSNTVDGELNWDINSLIQQHPKLESLPDCYCDNLEKKPKMYIDRKTGQFRCLFYYETFIATSTPDFPYTLDPVINKLDIHRECIKKIKSAK